MPSLTGLDVDGNVGVDGLSLRQGGVIKKGYMFQGYPNGQVVYTAGADACPPLDVVGLSLYQIEKCWSGLKPRGDNERGARLKAVVSTKGSCCKAKVKGAKEETRKNVKRVTRRDVELIEQGVKRKEGQEERERRRRLSAMLKPPGMLAQRKLH